MKRLLLFSLLGMFLLNSSKAQQAFWPDTLMAYQSRLSVLGKELRDGSTQLKREAAAKQIIPLFRKSLSVPGAFTFGFDSLDYMSKLVPEDQTFRLFTWVLRLDGNRYRYFGVIHVKDKDSFVYHPLFDRSVDVKAGVVGKQDPTFYIKDSIYSNNNWFGMFYYGIGTVTEKKWFNFKTKKYYVLTAWDLNNDVSHKKIIDVLHFEDNKPIFGAPIFHKDNGEVSNRFVLEFNAEATIVLKYHPKYDLISFDDLQPPSDKNLGNYFTYIPTGSYNYWIWKRNKFIFKKDLFNTFKRDIEEAL